MQKLGILVLGVILALVLGSTVIVSGESDEEMCIPMGDITLEPPESVEAKRSAVEFPHSRHLVAVDCKTCHHKWIGDEQIQTCTASGCHDLDVSPTKSEKSKIEKEQAIKYFKSAFHQMCIGCHKEMKIQNKKLEMSYKELDKELPNTGPTGCVQCHPKE
jgi:hypothetical protein